MDAHHPATAAAAPRKSAELIGIQYLRGIAAMMVVVFHLYPQLQRMAYPGAWLPGLSSGVDIFFVISGFIMWVTTWGKPIGPVEFWRRRIVRIVPLYWLITTFMVAVMLVAPQALQSSRYDLYHIVTSYLFWPSLHPVKPVMEPLTMPGWTLNYEMFFYLIFGIFLLAPARARLIGTIGTLAALIAIGTLAGAPKLSAGGFYTSSIMLEFALGMAVGAVTTRGDAIGRIPAWAAWIILLAAFAQVVVLLGLLGAPPRVVARGLGATLIVVAILAIEAHGRLPSVPLLRRLGDASYSIYLTHFVLLSAASQVWRKLHLDQLPGGLVLFCIAGTAGSALAGWMCFKWIEQPMTRYFRGSNPSGAALRPAAS